MRFTPFLARTGKGEEEREGERKSVCVCMCGATGADDLVSLGWQTVLHSLPRQTVASTRHKGPWRKVRSRESWWKKSESTILAAPWVKSLSERSLLPSPRHGPRRFHVLRSQIYTLCPLFLCVYLSLFPSRISVTYAYMHCSLSLSNTSLTLFLSLPPYLNSLFSFDSLKAFPFDSTLRARPCARQQKNHDDRYRPRRFPQHYRLLDVIATCVGHYAP